MKETLVKYRNGLISGLYQGIGKPYFFSLDPETAHERATSVGKRLGSHSLTRGLTSLCLGYSHPMLRQEILGISFPNPVGLAGGFDKDAQLTTILSSVGFGFVEVGSITGEPCAGNPRPRLWRLKRSRGLVVYYGLKNRGCERISSQLAKRKQFCPIGTNIAKTNSPDTVKTIDGIADYVKAFSHFVDIGDYFTINISCPNAFGGEPFNDPEKLDQLLSALDEIPTHKPCFLKLSPDLSREEIDAILSVSTRHRIHGFICSNLTKKRTNPLVKERNLPSQGGISGKPVAPLADSLIRYIFEKTNGTATIIGCGGVFTARDAYRKIRSGASLIQLITGMIYCGPQTISSINQGLVRLLKRDGFSSLTEAVGADVKRHK